MNLKTKVEGTLEQVRQIKGIYVDKVKSNSKEMEDYLQVNYFQGLDVGLSFVMYTLDNKVKEEDYDAMVAEMLSPEEEGSVN